MRIPCQECVQLRDLSVEAVNIEKDDSAYINPLWRDINSSIAVKSSLLIKKIYLQKMSTVNKYLNLLMKWQYFSLVLAKLKYMIN